MFTLYPAIDLLNGRCVRLYKGNYDQSTVYADSPVEVARSFYNQGAEWLHVVDLDGARSGHPVNREIILKIAEEMPIKVEIGGGIRSMATVDDYFIHGVRRIVLGSSAISDPEFTASALKKYPRQIAIGLDARGGKIAVRGWLELSDQTPVDLAKRLIQAGASQFIYTDISKDGAMSGTNRQAARQLAEKIGRPVVVSGGIQSLAELRSLIALGDRIVSGAIIGKAIYTGKINVREAIEAVNANAR